MAQVTVYTADGQFSTTANDTPREGEARSELERLLAGDIPGREGYVGGTQTAPSSLPESFTSNQDFFGKLEDVMSNFGNNLSNEEIEDVATPEQIEDLVPWLAGKGSLLQTYTDQYIETGSADFAIAAVRQSDEYASFYPGITRNDGSLRMSETQYEQTREGFFRILLENGLNPTVFDNAGKVSQLIQGDVSVAEFKTRVEQSRRAFKDNPIADQIKEYYSANFNVELSNDALFTAALDPDMSIGILTNQIDQAELGAEAALRNLDLSTTQAQRLIQAGITQEGSSRLFARGADAIGQLNKISRMQNRQTVIGLTDVIDAQVYQDPAAIREQGQILAQQQSASSMATGAARLQSGEVKGLTES